MLWKIPGRKNPTAAGAPQAPAGPDRLRADVLSALQNLGYHRPQAEKAIESAVTSMTDPTFEDALKSALRELMR